MSDLFTLTKEEIDRNTKAYKEYEELDMEDGWYDGDKNRIYRQLIYIANLAGPLKNSSCLDVGCGTGDFSAYLRKHGIESYTGIDIYKPAIEKARKKYPDEKFILGDMLKGASDEKYDYAFASGSFSLRFESLNNYYFLEAMLNKMWKMTKIGIAFNVLTDDDTDPDPDLFFYNLAKVQKILLKIAPCASLKRIKDTKESQSHFYIFRKK